MTDLDKLPEHLATIEKSGWKQLFDLIGEIERTKKFGELKGGEKLENGSISFPYWEPSVVVDKFWRTVHDLGLVTIFDWPGWDEGKAMLKNEQQDYEQLDVITLCKLITTIIRANRFSDGYLVGNFKNGTILKIIRSLQSKINGDEI